jgi:hypothetical protein
MTILWENQKRNRRSLHYASLRFHGRPGTGGTTNSFGAMTSREKSIKSQPLRMTILWEFDEKKRRVVESLP